MVLALLQHLIISETCNDWYFGHLEAAETRCEHNTDILLSHFKVMVMC